MGKNQQEKKFILKRQLTRLLVLFLVLYALADASVLQAYCGNETVGIPPAHHSKSAKETTHHFEHTEADAGKFIQGHDHQSDDQNSDQGCNDECLSCSHMVISSFFLAPVFFASFDQPSKPLNYESKHANSFLSELFRPPQTA